MYALAVDQMSDLAIVNITEETYDWLALSGDLPPECENGIDWSWSPVHTHPRECSDLVLINISDSLDELVCEVKALRLLDVMPKYGDYEDKLMFNQVSKSFNPVKIQMKPIEALRALVE